MGYLYTLIYFINNYNTNDINNLVKKYKVQAKLSPMLVKIFDEGIKKYGPRSWSTMVVKLLEDKSKTSLRSRGFPSILIDHKKRRNGIEIKII